MFTTTTTILSLALAATVSAHGRLDLVTGNLGGNTTGLGVKGAIIPGGGPNYMTEPDTTTFWSHTFATDQDDGFTDSSNGNLSPARNLAAVMVLSGSTLPQISASGGYVVGNWHVVTDDGCGPLQAAVDPTASSKWSTAVAADVTSDLPGQAGECVSEDSGDDQTPSPVSETILGSTEQRKSRRGLQKRAKNVNKTWAYKIAIPAGVTCTGTVNGISNLCQIKVSNNNQNGPFGGTYLVQQQSGTGTAAAASQSSAASNAASSQGASSCGGGNGKREEQFRA